MRASCRYANKWRSDRCALRFHTGRPRRSLVEDASSSSCSSDWRDPAFCGARERQSSRFVGTCMSLACDHVHLRATSANLVKCYQISGQIYRVIGVCSKTPGPRTEGVKLRLSICGNFLSCICQAAARDTFTTYHCHQKVIKYHRESKRTQLKVTFQTSTTSCHTPAHPCLITTERPRLLRLCSESHHLEYCPIDRSCSTCHHGDRRGCCNGFGAVHP